MFGYLDIVAELIVRRDSSFKDQFCNCLPHTTTSYIVASPQQSDGERILVHKLL